MGNYITVTWVTEAPAAKAVSYGDVCFLASGNAPDICDNPQMVTSSDYSSLIGSTTHEYKALVSYFKNFTGSPTNNTYVYWMGAGSEATGIAYGSDLVYNIKYPPFESIDTVDVDPTGGSNWQQIDPYNVTTAPSGFIAITGDEGFYNGYINFTGQLEGGVDVGGPYFDSGGVDYSGVMAREIMSASGGKIQIKASRNAFGNASQAIIPYGVQFIAAPYDVAAAEPSGVMGDSGAVDDLRNLLGMCAGNRMMAVWALPKAATPGSSYADASVDYENTRDYVGQDKNAIVIYADVATGSDGSGNDDPAAAYLGKIVDSAPHRTLTLADINIGLASRTNESDEISWTAGNIACIFQKSDLGFSTDQISYGFTFSGTTPSNRLNNVRCKYIVEYSILQDLWKMLSSRNVRISQSGIGQIIDTINATLDRLESQDIIDAGSRYVEIPLGNGTEAEWTNARLTRVIPAIIIRWSWNTSPEQLNITQFGEIL